MPILNGVTRNSAGAALAGVSIKVFRSDTDALVASGTSGADGSYSIITPGIGPYYAVAYKAGSPDIAGTTINTLTAEAFYTAGAAVAAGLAVALAGGALVKSGAAVAAGSAALSGVGEAASAAPAMPSGMITYLNTDTYNGAAKTLTNEVDGTAPKQNLLRLPYSFDISPWIAAAATITPNYAFGPDGVSNASRLLGANGFNQIRVDMTSVPAGTYTLAVYVKSNTGSSQNFRMWLGSFGLVTKTATTSWQRFTVTGAMTGGAESIYAIFGDGTNSNDLVICGAELYAGSSDLGPALPKGHLSLGKHAYAAPAVASGLIAAGELGSVIDFIADQTLSTFTAFVVGRKTAALEDHQAMFSNIRDFTAFSPMFEDGAIARTQLAGSLRIGDVYGAEKIRNPIGQGLLMFTVRYDGSNLDMLINDLIVMRQTGVTTSQSARDFWVGLYNGAYGIDYETYALGIANRAWSNTEIRAACAAQAQRATASGLTFNTLPRTLVSEGDSRAIAPGFADIYNANASPKIIGTHAAISGSTLATMSARAATTDALFRSGKTNLLSVMIGVNDLGGYSGGAAQYLTDLATYCDARRAAGWKVIVCTMLPSNADTTYNSRRATCNSAITSSWTGVHCDGVADFASDTQMGPDNAYATTPANWADGIHPNATGHARLEAIFRPVANAIT